MKISRIKQKLIDMTQYLENILAFVITIAIVIGMVDLLKYIVMIFQTNAIDTYDIFYKVCHADYYCCYDKYGQCILQIQRCLNKFGLELTHFH